MDSKKVAFCAAIVGLTLGACGGGNTTTDGGPGDGGSSGTYTFPELDKVCPPPGTAPCNTTDNAHTDQQRMHALPNHDGTAMTKSYVVNFVSLAVASGATTAPGFNLDMKDSDGSLNTDCTDVAADFMGLAPDNQVGVDDQLGSTLSPLGALAGTCPLTPMTGENNLDCLVRNQIETGTLILLVTVTGINDFTYDDQVMVQLALGHTTSGSAPMVDPGTHRLAAGQSFMSTTMIGSPVMGDIFNGRLRVTASQFTLALTVMGVSLSIPVSNPQIRFDITADSLANGALGGGVRIADVDSALHMMGTACTMDSDCTGGAHCTMGHCPSSLEGTVDGVLHTAGDLVPCTAAADCPWTTPSADVCTQISLGLALGGTSATVQ